MAVARPVKGNRPPRPNTSAARIAAPAKTRTMAKLMGSICPPSTAARVSRELDAKAHMVNTVRRTRRIPALTCPRAAGQGRACAICRQFCEATALDRFQLPNLTTKRDGGLALQTVPLTAFEDRGKLCAFSRTGGAFCAHCREEPLSPRGSLCALRYEAYLHIFLTYPILSFLVLGLKYVDLLNSASHSPFQNVRKYYI